MARCSECGRPLTDPESVRLGIGPVCREALGPMGVMAVLSKRKNETENLLSSYSVSQVDDVLVIKDLNRGGRSLTNDVERVLAELAAKQDLAGQVVIYRDSMGRYDGVEHENGLFKRFYPIGEFRASVAVQSAIVQERRRRAREKRQQLQKVAKA